MKLRRQKQNLSITNLAVKNIRKVTGHLCTQGTFSPPAPAGSEALLVCSSYLVTS